METVLAQQPPTSKPTCFCGSNRPIRRTLSFIPGSPSYVALFWQNVPCTFLSNLHRFPLSSLRWFLLSLFSRDGRLAGGLPCRSRGFLAAIHSSNFLRNSRKCLIALPLAEKQRDLSQSCVKGKRHRNRLL